MSEKKYLDLGTVVLLKNGKKLLMISGYNKNNKDYLGTLYPEGMILKDTIYLFDHDDIDKIFFNGFHSPMAETFLKMLPNHKKNNKYSRIQLLDIKKHNCYLPIGTIVFLKKSALSYMIAGYITKNEKTNYIGVCYPVGMDIQEGIIIFAHEDICNIRYVGYKNEKYIEFNKLLNKEKNNYKF